MTTMKQGPKDLPKTEWDFADCPKDEIYDCWLYEFSREIDWLKAAVARRRGPITTKYGATVQVDTLTGFARSTFYAFLLMPQWPGEPYLSISPQERQKWISWTRLQTEQEIRANSLVPVEVPKGIEGQLADCLQNVGWSRRPRVRSENNLTELALLRIDWTLADSELIRAFGAYIKEFRPLVPNSLPIRATGRGEPTAKREIQLEQLGLFRLLRANSQKINLAHAVTGREKGEDKSWYRAQRAVKKLLRNAETQIIPLLSRVELEDFIFLNTPSNR